MSAGFAERRKQENGLTEKCQLGKDSFCCKFKSQWHNWLLYPRESNLTDDLWRFP